MANLKVGAKFFSAVCDGQHLGETEHAGGAFDRVGVAEQARDDMARRGMRLEREQPSLKRRHALLDFSAKRR